MDVFRVLDWVSFTLVDETLPDAVLMRYGHLGFVEMEKGMHGYRRQMVAAGGGFRVLWDGAAGMGVHVQISGDGCRLVELLPAFGSWADELAHWRGCGARCRRLDLAIDDQAGLASWDRLEAHFREHSVTTRWKAEVDERAKRPMGAGWDVPQGRTFNLGSPTSDARLRIYDKAAEQNLPQGIHWIRFEWQFRDDRADIIFGLLSEGAWDAAVGVCRSYIEFRDYRLESNPSMAPVADWWDTLVAASRVCISKAKIAIANVDRMYSWVDRQVAPALAVLVTLEGSMEGALRRLVDGGTGRMKPKHHIMVAHARGAWAAGV